MRKWIGYEKGVNLGGWLSQCDYSKERLEHFIEEEDIKRLSTWGLDHLRLPMDYNVLREENGTFKKDGFDYVKRAVEWCCKKGIYINNVHKLLLEQIEVSGADGEQIELNNIDQISEGCTYLKR